MSTKLEHRLPPMTMSQYITAGLLLIFLEIVFVLLSNEADIITEDHMAWYNPFALMDFANKQMEINKENLKPRFIDLNTASNDIFPSELIHIYIIDQTTPNLRYTDMEMNYKDVMSPDSLTLRYGEIIDYGKIKEKLGQLTLQNIATFHLLWQSIRDNDQFKYIIYDYQGISSGADCLFPRKVGDSDEIMYQFAKGSTQKSGLATDFLKEKYNYRVNDTARTDFHEIFAAINARYKPNISEPLNKKGYKIVLNIISDFIHEEKWKNKKEKSLLSVKTEFENLMKGCDSIAAVNLVVLPYRKMDADKKATRDAMIENISKCCAYNSKPMKKIHHEAIFNAAQFLQAIDNLPTKVPIFDAVPLLVYQPFSDDGFEASAKCSFNFDSLHNIDAVTLQLKKTSGGGAANSMLRVLTKDKKFIGEIPEEPRMQDIKITKGIQYIGHFPHSGTANGFSDLSLVVSAKESVTSKSIPLKFIEKLTRMETEILGYVTALTVVFAFYWLVLLFTGKAFYNQERVDDWFHTFLKGAKDLMKKSLPLTVLVVIVLSGIIIPIWMCYLLRAFFVKPEDAQGAVFFVSLIAIYVSFTFYFHLRHFYVYTNPEERFKDNT